jgi:hypothetical protein
MIGECKMKKICSLLLVVCLIFLLSACGGNNSATDNDTGSYCVECGGEISSTDRFCGSCGASVNKTNSTPTTTTKPEISIEPAMTEDKLLSQIDAQELKVIKTKYVVQDEEYKSLYPDMLQAVIQNDTSYDIKNALVAFVAWDSNNLPVKIKGSIDFSDGSYIKEVNYGDINLVPGKKFGESSGFEVDENCNIKTFKAIVVSYETFDGTTWENPLYEDWCEFYEGVKLQ